MDNRIKQIAKALVSEGEKSQQVKKVFNLLSRRCSVSLEKLTQKEIDLHLNGGKCNASKFEAQIESILYDSRKNLPSTSKLQGIGFKNKKKKKRHRKRGGSKKRNKQAKDKLIRDEENKSNENYNVFGNHVTVANSTQYCNRVETIVNQETNVQSLTNKVVSKRYNENEFGALNKRIKLVNDKELDNIHIIIPKDKIFNLSDTENASEYKDNEKITKTVCGKSINNDSDCVKNITFKKSETVALSNNGRSSDSNMNIYKPETKTDSSNLQCGQGNNSKLEEIKTNNVEFKADADPLFSLRSKSPLSSIAQKLPVDETPDYASPENQSRTDVIIMNKLTSKQIRIKIENVISARKAFTMANHVGKLKKMSEVLHLAIGDTVKKESTIKHLLFLKSIDLISAETLRAERDYKYLLKIRSSVFCPLFSTTLSPVMAIYGSETIFVMYCLLVDFLIEIRKENDLFISELRKLIKTMCEAHKMRSNFASEMFDIDDTLFEAILLLTRNILKDYCFETSLDMYDSANESIEQTTHDSTSLNSSSLNTENCDKNVSISNASSTTTEMCSKNISYAQSKQPTLVKNVAKKSTSVKASTEKAKSVKASTEKAKSVKASTEKAKSVKASTEKTKSVVASAEKAVQVKECAKQATSVKSLFEKRTKLIEFQDLGNHKSVTTNNSSSGTDKSVDERKKIISSLQPIRPKPSTIKPLFNVVPKITPQHRIAILQSQKITNTVQKQPLHKNQSSSECNTDVSTNSDDQWFLTSYKKNDALTAVVNSVKEAIIDKSNDDCNVSKSLNAPPVASEKITSVLPKIIVKPVDEINRQWATDHGEPVTNETHTESYSKTSVAYSHIMESSWPLVTEMSRSSNASTSTTIISKEVSSGVSNLTSSNVTRMSELEIAKHSLPINNVVNKTVMAHSTIKKSVKGGNYVLVRKDSLKPIPESLINENNTTAANSSNVRSAKDPNIGSPNYRPVATTSKSVNNVLASTCRYLYGAQHTGQPNVSAKNSLTNSETVVANPSSKFTYFTSSSAKSNDNLLNIEHTKEPSASANNRLKHTQTSVVNSSNASISKSTNSEVEINDGIQLAERSSDLANNSKNTKLSEVDSFVSKSPTNSGTKTIQTVQNIQLADQSSISTNNILLCTETLVTETTSLADEIVYAPPALNNKNSTETTACKIPRANTPCTSVTDAFQLGKTNESIGKFSVTPSRHNLPKTVQQPKLYKSSRPAIKNLLKEPQKKSEIKQQQTNNQTTEESAHDETATQDDDFTAFPIISNVVSLNKEFKKYLNNKCYDVDNGNSDDNFFTTKSIQLSAHSQDSFENYNDCSKQSSETSSEETLSGIETVPEATIVIDDEDDDVILVKDDDVCRILPTRCRRDSKGELTTNSESDTIAQENGSMARESGTIDQETGAMAQNSDSTQSSLCDNNRSSKTKTVAVIKKWLTKILSRQNFCCAVKSCSKELKQGQAVLICSACNRACYCSIACQNLDWKLIHNVDCGKK